MRCSSKSSTDGLSHTDNSEFNFKWLLKDTYSFSYIMYNSFFIIILMKGGGPSAL